MDRRFWILWKEGRASLTGCQQPCPLLHKTGWAKVARFSLFENGPFLMKRKKKPKNMFLFPKLFNPRTKLKGKNSLQKDMGRGPERRNNKNVEKKESIGRGTKSIEEKGKSKQQNYILDMIKSNQNLNKRKILGKINKSHNNPWMIINQKIIQRIQKKKKN